MLGNVGDALNVIKERCNTDPLKDILIGDPTPIWPLAKDPRIIKYLSTCKRELKKNGANSKSTDALFIIINKVLSFTKKEWLLIKTLGPDNETIKQLLKSKQ